MSIEPQTIIVNEDIQEDYIVYDRLITPNPELPFNENILVTNDNKSNRLYFNMWYTFDDRELENKDISIVWINALGERGITPCGDKQLTGDRLSFSWDVPAEATVAAGDITFAIHIITERYRWNTLPTTVEVKQGLITQEYEELPPATDVQGWLDIVQGLQDQITALEERVTALENNQ